MSLGVADDDPTFDAVAQDARLPSAAFEDSLTLVSQLNPSEKLAAIHKLVSSEVTAGFL
jgi:hypothetical protein